MKFLSWSLLHKGPFVIISVPRKTLSFLFSLFSFLIVTRAGSLHCCSSMLFVLLSDEAVCFLIDQFDGSKLDCACEEGGGLTIL